MRMTKNDIREQIIEQLGGALTIEQATAIEYIGKVLKEVSWDLRGSYLNAEERDANAKKPMTVAEDLHDVSLVLGDKRIVIDRASDSKPAVSVPFGLSDKVTQATLPKDWMLQALYQFIINADDGDTTYAEEVAQWINKWLDIATVDKDGRISIDKNKLPAPTAEVFTSDLVASHKRMSKSKAKGSATFNISLRVEEIVDDETPLRIPPNRTGFALPIGTNSPELAPPSRGIPNGEEGSEGKGGAPSYPIPDEANVEVSTNALLVDDEWKAEGLLRDIIAEEPLTKGAIRKAIDGRVPEPMWVAELDRLVKEGVILSTTTGGPRSTRYTMGVTA